MIHCSILAAAATKEAADPDFLLQSMLEGEKESLVRAS